MKVARHTGAASNLPSSRIKETDGTNTSPAFDGNRRSAVFLWGRASGDRDHILSGVFNQFLSEKSEPAE